MACDDLITNQDLENAKKDATTMSNFVESDSPEIQSKNGKNIRTLQGINDAADNLISSLGGTDIGDYEDDLTLNSYNEYVVFDRAGATTGPSLWKAIPPRTPTPGTPLPYTIDSATYPDPSIDPNIEPFSDINKAGAEQIAQEESNTGDSQLAGGPIWPLSSQEIAQVGDSGLINILFVRGDGDLYRLDIDGVPSVANGTISAIDFLAMSATIGGVDYDLNQLSISELNEELTSQSIRVDRASINDNERFTPYPSKGDKASFNSLLAWDAQDREDDKFDPSDVVFYRFPQILKLPSGTLYIVTTTMHGGNEDPGQVANRQYDLTIKISTDNGNTWGQKTIIAQFGPTFQNVDATLIYDFSIDRIWCFFTSCKGQTGIGFSQSGTTDPDLSSQVYYTYSDGESNSWIAPVNITSTIKPDEAEFIGIGNGKGFAFPDGNLAIPILTTTSGPLTYTTNMLKYDVRNDSFTLKPINSGLTGGEHGLHLLPDGSILSQARGLQVGGKGQQLFFYSYNAGEDWTQDTDATITTTDVKGSLVQLSDTRIDGRLLWAFVAANGATDNQEDRQNLRCWVSGDKKNWTRSTTNIFASQIGYVLAVKGSGDEMLCTSEAGGQSGIFFHTFSRKYIFNRTFDNEPIGVISCNNSNADNLSASGAIPNHDVFYNSQINSMCATNGGSWIPFLNFDPTFTFTSSLTSIDVRGKSIIQVDGSGSLDGLSNGYEGQVVTIVSSSGSNACTLNRLSGSVGPDERFFYDLDGNTSLVIQLNSQQLATFVKTSYGWVTETKANTP